jgi:hypothetical protein
VEKYALVDGINKERDLYKVTFFPVVKRTMGVFVYEYNGRR